MQGELLVGGLHDGRPDQGRVRVWRPHVLHPVEFPVLGQVLLWVEVRVATVMVGHLTKLGSKLGEPKLGLGGKNSPYGGDSQWEGWLGRPTSRAGCFGHCLHRDDVRAPALPIFEQKTHLRPEVGVLGKEAMFMFELRAARGDMDGEEGVSSIR